MRIDSQSGASGFRGGLTGFWPRRSATKADDAQSSTSSTQLGASAPSIGLVIPDSDLPPASGIGLPQPASETDADKDKSSFWSGDDTFYQTKDWWAAVKGDDIDKSTRATPSSKAFDAPPANGDDSQPGKADGTSRSAPGDKADKVIGTKAKNADAPKSQDPDGLTNQQREIVLELQRRDTEVHAHEAAHEAAAGSLGSGPSFGYTTGPDGKRYAVSGEVSVQVSQGRTPEETIRNAEQVRAAALAPADPSAQDRAVASEATQMEADARAEMATLHAEEARQSADAAESHQEATQAQDDAAVADPAAASAPVVTAASPDAAAVTGASEGVEATKGTTATSDALQAGAPRATTVASTRHAASHTTHALAIDSKPATRQDPDELLRQLENEQQSARGGWRHLHASGNCSCCAQAAAAYR